CPIDLIYDEVFVVGTEPTEKCNLHTPVADTTGLPKPVPDTTKPPVKTDTTKRIPPDTTIAASRR
ncbi:MAG TPA: hypothetical protein VK864_05435, partial [Longimicrobiales bacterium]|nr:hypothetical protein [Longimicrobiales bacterium]